MVIKDWMLGLFSNVVWGFVTYCAAFLKPKRAPTAGRMPSLPDFSIVEMCADGRQNACLAYLVTTLSPLYKTKIPMRNKDRSSLEFLTYTPGTPGSHRTLFN
ncbi:MAG: hypothetical protein SOH56_10065 [Lentilactobacillus sunkii]|uniref:hypothetical protein n=1 Tax=Lentilactobacillus sunkii TaxID=481719 RepID=UPI002F35B800